MFDFGEGAMTMTVSPDVHYAELAALASLIRWADRVDESCGVEFLTDDQLPMYDSAVRLRQAYGRDVF